MKLNNSYVLYSNQQLPYADSNGRTLLPLRLIGDVVGAAVSWSAKEQKASVTMGADNISIILNEKIALVNGQKKQMDTVAVVKNSTIMVPARFIAEEFKIKITFDKITNVVHLDDPRILSAERINRIDEMERVDDNFNGEIIPLEFSFFKDVKNSVKNRINVNLQNYSSQAIKKDQLNRNIIFFVSNSKLAFIGTRGMIAPDGSTGVNSINIKANSIYNDEIYIESLKNDEGEAFRYIFGNYFITTS
ncbi:copper amine oxidase N-terminal domain-containing protein [Paenibacillus sp. FSL L8-0436]|uniref:copper amine oxidase N-terminal domain-containing protein n=1 Tax=Paenibacillus sp. FSL L8-0436 TaxID=2954686 RepID=UPI00315985C1